MFVQGVQKQPPPPDCSPTCNNAHGAQASPDPPVFLVTVGWARLHWKRSSHCQMSEAVLISHFRRVSASRQHPRWWLRLHTPCFVLSSRVCPQISPKAARFGLIIISDDCRRTAVIMAECDLYWIIISNDWTLTFADKYVNNETNCHTFFVF